MGLTSLGPATLTWKYLALLSSASAVIPGTGSAISRCVSWRKKKINCQLTPLRITQEITLIIRLGSPKDMAQPTLSNQRKNTSSFEPTSKAKPAFTPNKSALQKKKLLAFQLLEIKSKFKFKMASSFKKKGSSSKPLHPLGSRPSLYNAQLLVSSGVPSMDLLLGCYLYEVWKREINYRCTLFRWRLSSRECLTNRWALVK